jgi:flagellar hook-associated protein 2
MAGMNVDGLVSGLDTTSLIRQLMQLERQPQARLTARKSEVDALADLYRQINTKLQAVTTAAEALNLGTDWQVAKATSSDTARVTATAVESAPAGSLTFTVTSLASARTIISDGTVASATDTGVYSAGFTVNGVSIDDVGDGSLTAVASAITASDAGVTATVVKVGTDAYRLQLAAKANGPGESVNLVGLEATGLGTFTTLVNAGSLAEISVNGAYTVTSETNTVADVISGVTFTLLKADPATEVTVTVGTDRDKIADRVESLVTAVNDAMKLIRDNSGYDTATKKAGPLLANSMTSRLATDLQRALTDPVTGASLVGAGVGIEVDRYGAVTFDRDAFLAAYDDDPTAVQRVFDGGTVGDTADDGLAERLRTYTAAATGASGTISLALDGLARTTRSLDDQIAGWDNRLALREAALKRQFAAMEAALGRAQSTSSWLAGQIAGLPTYDS